MEKKFVYDFSIEGFTKFSNENKVPLIFQDISFNGTGEMDCPAFRLYCYEKDKLKVENFIYWSKPIYAYSEINTVKQHNKLTGYTIEGLRKLLPEAICLK